MATSTRVCNLCEAMCGLTIEHDGGVVHSIRGNRDDLFSAGAFCPKSQGLLDLYQDPDRIRRPLKRVGDEFIETTWEEAFTDIAARVQALQDTYGCSSVATYVGNPNAHHAGNLLFLPAFLGSLHTRNKASATSVDQLPHMLAAYLLYGHQLLLPIADVDHAEYMLILGANPAVSNGSLLSGAGLSTRIKAVHKRGGKVVVFDPRYTETAAVASEHHFIRPGSDVYFLAAVVQKLLEAPRLRHLAPLVNGLDELRPLIGALDVGSLEALTGVSAATASTVAADLLRYDRGVCYGRVGVSTQAHGGLCQWLINLINILSGNLDRRGGALFTKPAIDVVALMAKTGGRGSFDRYQSRVGGLPEFGGEIPAATLAGEMLTPGKGQVRGFFTVAGNPVLSLPNGPKLEKALAGLDLYVAVDFYKNETTRLAHYILPPVSPLEHDHYDLIFNALAVRNNARYSPRLLTPPPDSYEDWEILLELWARIGVKRRPLVALKRRLTAATLRRLGLAFILDKALRFGPYRRRGMSLKKLLAAPNGVDLGPLTPSLPQRLFTRDKLIQLVPPQMAAAWRQLCSDHAARTTAAVTVPSPSAPLLLIGRRNLKSNNSWMHNCASLSKGRSQCYALIHPADAAARQINDGDAITVSTAVGAITLPAHYSDRIMPGVVSIPHGWGHHRQGVALNLAAANPGVSLNDILSDSAVDAFSGNAALVGQPATVVCAQTTASGGVTAPPPLA